MSDDIRPHREPEDLTHAMLLAIARQDLFRAVASIHQNSYSAGQFMAKLDAYIDARIALQAVVR